MHLHHFLCTGCVGLSGTTVELQGTLPKWCELSMIKRTKAFTKVADETL